MNRGRSGSLLFPVRRYRSTIRYRVPILFVLRSADLLTIRRSLLIASAAKPHLERKTRTNLLRSFEQSSPLRLRFPRCFLRSGSGSRDESGMIRVDVRGLNCDERLDVFRGRSESFPQQLRDDLDQLGVQSRITLQFLFANTTSQSSSRVRVSMSIYEQRWYSCDKSSSTPRTPTRRIADSAARAT